MSRIAAAVLLNSCDCAALSAATGAAMLNRRPKMRLPDDTNREGFSQSSALSDGKALFSSNQTPHCTKIYHLRPQNLTPWLDICFPECEIEADTSENQRYSMRTFWHRRKVQPVTGGLK